MTSSYKKIREGVYYGHIDSSALEDALKFYHNLEESQQDIDPEIAKIINDNFFDLIEGE